MSGDALVYERMVAPMRSSTLLMRVFVVRTVAISTPLVADSPEGTSEVKMTDHQLHRSLPLKGLFPTPSLCRYGVGLQADDRLLRSRRCPPYVWVVGSL